MKTRRKPTREQVRRNLERAVEAMGGAWAVSVKCAVNERTVRGWCQRGAMNGVPVEVALRFAKLARKSIHTFLCEE